ncbi:lysophospholipid acyltransferase family protein [Nonomuraea polychroma]|uniref:lysophospholipid acyltransferase family protein n=1 Tax=Nonomuraea polychroma TaxID=46176 RepID=UPI003D8F102B
MSSRRDLGQDRPSVLRVGDAGGRAAAAALQTGLRVLEQGKLLGIYPEGTRAPDTRLYKGKTGVARLALTARVPVIPTAVIDTFGLLPEGRILPRLRVRPTIRFGEPLDFSDFYGRENDHAALRTVTDQIMLAIQKLSGQEYVDTYAATAKARRAEEATG